MPRPAKMQIDLTALRHNCALISQVAPNSQIVAVIKANAYGHGAIQIAEALQGYISLLAVSCVEEAMLLRREDIKTPILLLEGCFEASELLCASQNNMEVVFHNQQQIDDLLSKQLPKPIRAWLKVDSGMHRLGLKLDEALDCYRQLKNSNNVKDGIVLMTQIASADDLGNAHTQKQLADFHQLHQTLEKEFDDKIETSIGNSATIMGWETGSSDWIRPGIMLYGVSPLAESFPLAEKLEPVMTLKSEIIALREVPKGGKVGYGSTWEAEKPSVIATVAIGYGDGYPRNAKSGTPVLVNGQRAYVAGRVSMDMLSIDVTHISDVKVGDEVILWGKGLDINEIAQWANTIGHELMTRMPMRVPKNYC